MKSLFTLCLSLFLFTITVKAQSLQGKIVFSYQCDTCHVDSLFAMSNNGLYKEFITVGYRPRLSHNGKYLAFSKGHTQHYTGYNTKLWIRNLVTMKDTQIISNQSDYLDYYDFSPSDTKIIYSQSCAIYSTNIDGSNAYTNISSAGCYSDDPNVRLSDSLITFHETYNGLYTLKINGTSQTKIPHTYPGDLFPAWSPNGQWIAYLKGAPGNPYVCNNLFKIKPDGSDSTQLTYFPALLTGDTIDADPVWAEDMQSIYIMGSIHDTLGMWRVMADGSGKYNLVYKWPSRQSAYCFWLGLADSIATEPSAIEPARHEMDFTVSPNPAEGELRITNADFRMGDIVSLIDLSGRIVQNRIIATPTSNLELKTSHLTNGLYLLRVKTQNGVATRKLVVQHR